MARLRRRENGMVSPDLINYWARGVDSKPRPEEGLVLAFAWGSDGMSDAPKRLREIRPQGSSPESAAANPAPETQSREPR